MLFNRLKSDFVLVWSLQNVRQWLTTVFSKIDITMTTINQKPLKSIKLLLATSQFTKTTCKCRAFRSAFCQSFLQCISVLNNGSHICHFCSISLLNVLLSSLFPALRLWGQQKEMWAGKQRGGGVGSESDETLLSPSLSSPPYLIPLFYFASHSTIWTPANNPICWDYNWAVCKLPLTAVFFMDNI